MSGTYSPYAVYMPPAFRGMKADSMDDNVDTFAAAATITFGTVVGRSAANALTVQAGKGSGHVGVALHDHIIASRGGYQATDAVSVLTRGRAWCWVSAAATAALLDGKPVFADDATGRVQDVATGGTQVQHAVFRSGTVSVPAIDGSGNVNIAMVELHYPFQPSV